MDNYLKENRNGIEYQEIQEHFSLLGDWIWRTSKRLCTQRETSPSHPYGKLRRSTAPKVDWRLANFGAALKERETSPSHPTECSAFRPLSWSIGYGVSRSDMKRVRGSERAGNLAIPSLRTAPLFMSASSRNDRFFPLERGG